MKNNNPSNLDAPTTLASAEGNHPQSQRLYLGWIAWGVLVGLLVLTRLLPYALPRVLEKLFGLDGQALAYYMFNVTPLGAGAVFGGAVFASRVQALALPLAVWAVSDALLTLMGWAPIPGLGHVLVQYPLFLAMAVLGMWWLRTKMNAWRMLGACLASGILFLLVVDFRTWLTSRDVPLPPEMPSNYLERLAFAFRPEAFLHLGGYPKTLDGLLTCYLMGLPFSLRFMGSTLAFGLVFYLAYIWAVERARIGRIYAWQTQPLSEH
ncbi:MAG: DUF6580 family putative transport protein [Gemmatales bacterium]|nr:DUF6580 family putative transport protein [Gemmatales bacterium]